jgi:hypothetical protein
MQWYYLKARHNHILPNVLTIYDHSAWHTEHLCVLKELLSHVGNQMLQNLQLHEARGKTFLQVPSVYRYGSILCLQLQERKPPYHIMTRGSQFVCACPSDQNNILVKRTPHNAVVVGDAKIAPPCTQWMNVIFQVFSLLFFYKERESLVVSCQCFFVSSLITFEPTDEFQETVSQDLDTRGH